MASKASNSELSLFTLEEFKAADPLSQGRRLTLIRRAKTAKRLLLVVHGLKSSAKTWRPFIEAAYDCAALKDCDFAAFEYQTAILGRLWFPFRKVNAEDWSRVLSDTLKHSLLSQGGYEEIVMVGHSMGGIVCKMAIRDLVHEGTTDTVNKIHSVFTYATPHFGSDRAFAPTAVLSYDIAFLRTNSDSLQGLQRFWNTRVGVDKDVKVHERAIVSAKDEVVPMISASGGLSQNDIFHVATSHTKVHCPDDARDRRITWLCEQLEQIDRRSATELVDIHNLPNPMSYNTETTDFISEIFKMVFVLAVGKVDDVAVGDQFQLFYEPESTDAGGNAPASKSALQWNLLEATRVEERQTFASLISFSHETAIGRLNDKARELGISNDARPTEKQVAELVHSMFDHAAARISRAETQAARFERRAVKRAEREEPGGGAWRRATHDVLECAEQFLQEYPDSPLAEGMHFDRAFALKSLGRIEEARSRFLRFTQTYPFSVSTKGAHQHIKEIDYRMAASDDPDDLYKVLRLGTYLMEFGDFVEGAHIVQDKLLQHPDELKNCTPTTRLDLYAFLVASELLGERFSGRPHYGRWLESFRADTQQQESAATKIQACEEPQRTLLQALHDGLFDDMDTFRE